MDRSDLPTGTERQYRHLYFPSMPVAGLSRAGRTVRKPGSAVGGDQYCAIVSIVGSSRPLADRWRQQYLHPDQPVCAGGSGQ